MTIHESFLIVLNLKFQRFFYVDQKCCCFFFFVSISEGTWIRSNCIVCMWTQNFLIINDDNDDENSLDANGEKKTSLNVVINIFCANDGGLRDACAVHGFIFDHIGFWYRVKNIATCACIHFGKWLKRFECQNLIRMIRSMVWLALVLFLVIFRWFFSYGPIMK